MNSRAPWPLSGKEPAFNVGAAEMRVQSLGQEGTLEEGMASHSIFLPGESHGQRSPWGRKESDMAEAA